MSAEEDQVKYMHLIGATVSAKFRVIYPRDAVSAAVPNDIQEGICTALIVTHFDIRVINRVDTLCAIIK
jgi:hypothetical protein